MTRGRGTAVAAGCERSPGWTAQAAAADEHRLRREARSTLTTSATDHRERGTMMKKAGVLVCALFVVSPLLALDAYPRTTIVELGTQVG